MYKCSGATCVVDACEAGWGDCDGDPSTGCETALDNPAHCGSCTKSCGGGTPKCSGGSCVASCTPPLTDCTGACVNLATAPGHCGDCATPCSYVAGLATTPTCAGGTCGSTAGPTPMPPTCAGADLTSDPANCGACGKVCQPPSAGSAACVGGACTFACPAGTAACGGACVDLKSDRFHCGDCTTTCAGTCVGASCAAALPSTFVSGVTPTAMAADGTNVYWIEGNDIWMAPAVASPTATKLAPGEAAPYDIDVDATHVYWSNKLGGAIMRIPKTGGTSSVVGTATSPLHIALDATYVYWHDALGIQRAPKAGGSTQLLYAAPTPSYITEVGVARGFLYFLEYSAPSSSTGDVRRLPVDGSAAPSLWWNPGSFNGGQNLAVDALVVAAEVRFVVGAGDREMMLVTEDDVRVLSTFAYGPGYVARPFDHFMYVATTFGVGIANKIVRVDECTGENQVVVAKSSPTDYQTQVMATDDRYVYYFD